MSLKSNIKGLFGADKKSKETILYAPVGGRIVPIGEVKDETFALGILGGGVAVLPLENELRAPAKGRIEQVFDSAHAVTMITDGGAELLIHVGIDTVELGGKYFDCPVESGARVEKGDVLLRFDRQKIAEAGYDLTTPLVIGNSDSFELSVVARGDVKAGEPILQLRRKEG